MWGPEHDHQMGEEGICLPLQRTHTVEKSITTTAAAAAGETRGNEEIGDKNRQAGRKERSGGYHSECQS